jgi:hypothetical protein
MIFLRLSGSIALVVFTVRSYPAYRNYPVFEGNLDFQPVPVPADVEDHDLTVQKARRRMTIPDVLWSGPRHAFGLVKPCFNPRPSVGMSGAERIELVTPDDPHGSTYVLGRSKAY